MLPRLWPCVGRPLPLTTAPAPLARRVYDQRKIDEKENNGVLKKFCPHHLVRLSPLELLSVAGGGGGEPLRPAGADVVRLPPR